ncbi:phosphocholine-specific phospholipase C [Pollutibacter soli]|uniref:phosphocholine-specific phospholipase C n=1 Tax=Pollutibacter soli TaxID=3034157 RepID=UPI003013513A
MDTRREFLKRAAQLSAGTGLINILPASIAKAMAIDPAPGSTFMDAEHIVFLMQENRSFDHTYGTLQGVRGFNDPRAIRLPDNNPVWLQTNAEGKTFAPFHYDIHNSKITWMSSLPHSWSNQVDARNDGKYDKWLQSKRSGHKEYADMPLTMGFFTREDIPFYYSLADAFTVCDQNFCSALTGTTPNRLYFWTGTIREKPDANALAAVWNGDADYGNMVGWKTCPEVLEENKIPWKIYQNELSVGVGFEGEEDAWLANFTDNSIEFFKQYNVKLHPEYIAALPKISRQLDAELLKREEKAKTLAADSPEAQRNTDEIGWIKQKKIEIEEDKKNCTAEKFNTLSEFDKNIHKKAFDTNRGDADYHKLTSLKYNDNGVDRELLIPKGDILYQFRKDVESNQLPTVSWLVAPENFSDHPGAAWYGAWYISEVMDILTKNPEIWKKTIFILTYDENDGYFDHIPPFVVPHPYKKDTGLVSAGINTGVEYVANADQQSDKEHIRVSPIGLGYRVPLVIASPWSRGGYVNSEVFDHTSSLQFLEKFLSQKFKRKIVVPEISAWRRAICGDLSSTFRPYNGEKINLPKPVEKEEFIESIHKAKFRNVPSNYKQLTSEEIAQINKDPLSSSLIPDQEKGTRPSNSLPYVLNADARYSADKNSIEIILGASNTVFGSKSAGAPFHVYTRGKFRNENASPRAYAVSSGDQLKDSWTIRDFENGNYHLLVYGPNGFFREFSGSENEVLVNVSMKYDTDLKRIDLLTGSITLGLENLDKKEYRIELIDNAYGAPKKDLVLPAAGTGKGKVKLVTLSFEKSHRWYDFSVRIAGNNSFERRYAGRVETGKDSITDPLMGRVL